MARVNNTTLRTSEFRIGTWHGVLNPQKPHSEAELQRALYLKGKLRLVLAKDRNSSLNIDVRIIGYEIPLYDDRARGEAIDLLGYDKDLNWYIIELKGENSTERLKKVVRQVNRYAVWFRRIRQALECEVAEQFLLNPNLRPFKEGRTPLIRRIIVAPYAFYTDKQTEARAHNGSVFLTYIVEKTRTGEGLDILRRPIPVRLAVLNRRSVKAVVRRDLARGEKEQ